MRRGLGTTGIALGIVMLGFLALFPEKGWAACLGLALALGLVAGERGGLRGIVAPGTLGLIVLMSLVSLAVTLSPAVALTQLWLLWAGIGAFCLLCLWARTRARLLWAGAGLTALGAALALFSPFSVNWFTERKTFFPPVIYEFFPRVVSDTIHPNVMASLMAGLLFIPLAWAVAPPQMALRRAWISRALSSRILWAVAAFLQVLVLVLTKSRGGYAAAAIGVALFALLMVRRRRWFLWTALGALAVAVVLVIWIPSSVPVADLSDLEALNAGTLAFRQRLWRYALLLIGDFPFTGIGMQAFNRVLPAIYGYRVTTDPGAHSIFLQVALDLGIPGLTGFVALLILVLFRSVRACITRRRAGDSLWILTAGATAGLVATLAQGLVDIAAWGTRGSFVLWCLLGLLAALAEYARRERNPASTDPAESAAIAG